MYLHVSLPLNVLVALQYLRIPVRSSPKLQADKYCFRFHDIWGFT